MKIENKIYGIVLSIFYINSICIGQSSTIPIKFWGLQSVSGLIGTEGDYKFQNIQLRNTYKDKLESSVLTGQFLLNTDSYFYHPNLLELETNMQFNPGTRKNIYLVIPDRSDIIVGESIRGTLKFLQTLPTNFSFFTNYNHTFTNREYTTDLETNNFGYGGYFNYRNKVVPVSINYQSNKIKQDELRTNRKYIMDRNNLKLNTEFTFTDIDENRAVFSFDGYNQEYTSLSKIRSNISTYSYFNRIKLDSTYSSLLSSNVIYTQNRGTYEYDRFQINENATYLILPNLKSAGNYLFNKITRDNFTSTQQNINGMFEHHLYKSLISNIRVEHIGNTQTFSNETMNTYGFGISYRKKIPVGVLNLSYDYSRRNVDRENLQEKLIILSEVIILNNDEITVLENPYVDLNSIIVKNSDGSIIFQENIDYIILVRNDYVEIQRITGGHIPEGLNIFVDYIAEQQPSYCYSLNSNKFNARLGLFENIIEFYSRILRNDYANVSTVYTNMLQIISQNVFGAKISYKFITAGAEIDEYKSNIIPFKSNRYYFRFSNRLSTELITNISGNLKYVELLKDNQKQEFHDVNANVIYNINSNVSVNLESSYRFQKGKGLDLELGILKGEIDFRFRNMYFVVGAEKYNRNFIDEKIDYLGGFVRIQRKF